MLGRRLGSLLLGLCLLGSALPTHAKAAGEDAAIVVAQAEGTRDGELEPRYQPRQPEAPDAYNDEYLFALTRSVASGAITPAGKVALYVLTVPLDLVFLPFALVGGLFG